MPQKFLMTLKPLLGIACLFLALNFGAIIHAEVNGAIPSIGGRYFDSRVEISVPAFAQDDPRWSDVRLGPQTDDAIGQDDRSARFDSLGSILCCRDCTPET